MLDSNSLTLKKVTAIVGATDSYDPAFLSAIIGMSQTDLNNLCNALDTPTMAVEIILDINGTQITKSICTRIVPAPIISLQLDNLQQDVTAIRGNLAETLPAILNELQELRRSLGHHEHREDLDNRQDLRKTGTREKVGS